MASRLFLPAEKNPAKGLKYVLGPNVSLSHNIQASVTDLIPLAGFENPKRCEVVPAKCFRNEAGRVRLLMGNNVYFFA
jgi:hypothetical protein